MSGPLVPVRDLTTREVLYGARTTSFRYELLEHDPVTGADALVGVLDGVVPGGSLSWSAARSVKKSGMLPVLDLRAARPGMVRLAEVPLVRARIRPVLLVDGLPEIPLGVYLVSSAPEAWSGTGLRQEIELLDKSSALNEDEIEVSFTAGTAVPVLTLVRQVIESSGERISVDLSDARTLANPLVFEVGTSRLQIVNRLLEALNYNSLWMDGTGAFQATPQVRPAQRSVHYSMLSDPDGRLLRELRDGAESVYESTWDRDRDVFGVPNRVIAVQAADGESEPLVGVAVNEDPASEFSFAARGRWITRTLEAVEVPEGSAGSQQAFLNERAQNTLIAASSVQATVNVRCLPLPVELLDAVLFASSLAGLDGVRHVVRAVEWDLRFDGLMGLTLQEAVDL